MPPQGLAQGTLDPSRRGPGSYALIKRKPPSSVPAVCFHTEYKVCQPLFQLFSTSSSSQPRFLLTFPPFGSSAIRPPRPSSNSDSTLKSATISNLRASPRASEIHCLNARRRKAAGALASKLTLSKGGLVSSVFAAGFSLASRRSSAALSTRTALSSLNKVAVRESASTILLLNDCIKGNS